MSNRILSEGTQFEVKVDFEESDNFPAGFLTEIWRLHAKGAEECIWHRDNGPAYSVMTPDTYETVEAKWLRYGQPYRIGGPAYMLLKDGIRTEVWSVGTGEHRENGPAITIRRESDGLCLEEYWCVHGNLHRYNGPAVVKRDAETGEVKTQAWYHHGRRQPSPQTSQRTATLSPD